MTCFSSQELPCPLQDLPFAVSGISSLVLAEPWIAPTPAAWQDYTWRVPKHEGAH